MKKILSLAICLLMVMSLFVGMNVIAVESDELPITGWKVQVSSVNKNNGVEGEKAEYAIDGNENTWWFSQITNPDPLPHFITIELPSVTAMGGFRYYPRTDTAAGNCTKYELYLSLDNKKFQKVSEGTYSAADYSPKTITFDKNYNAKYVRLQILNSHGGFGCAKEVRVLKPQAGKSTASLVPTVSIDSLKSGASVSSSSSSSGNSGSVATSSGTVSGAADELTVNNWKVYVSDVNKNNGVEGEKAEYAIDGNDNTWWFTQVTNQTPLPHYITVELPQITEIGGYRYSPRTDTAAGNCTQYEIYLSNDNKTFQKVAEGKWSAADYSPKTIIFDKNYKAKFVRLQILNSHGGYGCAKEVRPLKAVAGKATANLTPTVTIENLGKGSGTSTSGTSGSTGTSTGTVTGTDDEMPINNWKVYVSDVNKNGGVETEKAEYAIDGNENTWWITQITNQTPLPHYITVELPQVTEMGGFRYYPRTDTAAGNCTKYELYLSNDNKTFQKVSEGTYSAADYSPKTIMFDKNYKAKYVRLQILNSHGGYGCAKEVKVLKPQAGKASANITPNVNIDQLKSGIELGGAAGTTPATPTVSGAADEYAVNGWKVTVSSVNKNNGVEGEKAEYAIDGKDNTWWFTQITNPDPLPHFITIELPQITEIGGYRYSPRTDTAAGNCTQYEIYLSTDNIMYEKVAEGKWSAGDYAPKTILFEKNYKAKYVRLQILDSHGKFGCAKEVRVLKPQAGKTTANLNATVKLEDIDLNAPGADEIPVTNWKATASSFNINNGVPGEIPAWAFDDNPKTHWQTIINPKAEPPHYLTIELPRLTDIAGVRYYPRPDGGAGVASKYEIYLSYDNENYQKVAEGEWPLNVETKTVEFDKNYKTKFIRLRIMEGTGGYASVSEIRFLSPRKNKDYALLNPTVKSAEIGGSKPTGIVPVDAVPASIPKGVFSLDEISTEGWTFDVSSSNDGSPASKVIDGDQSTWWITRITDPDPLPHYITTILPKEEVISGFRYYPSTESAAGRCKKYEIHVSHNGTDFEKIAEGEWINDFTDKAAYFDVNVKVKAVKLVILASHGDYGSAGEIRLVKADPKKETVDASDYVAKTTKYNVKSVIFAGVTVMANKPNEYPFENMFDGNLASYYKSKTVIGEDRFPITLDINLKSTYTLQGLRYQPPVSNKTEGQLRDFDIEYSLDGTTYQSAGNYIIEAEDYASKSFYFDAPIKAKYVRIKVNYAVSNVVSIGELGFLQTEEDYEREKASAGESYILRIGSNEIKVKKNGVENVVTTDVAPFIHRDYTLIPLRGLLEQMGAKVNWIEYDQKIEVVTEDGAYMLFQIEEDRVYIDNIRYNTPVAPIIKDGRTFIPLRFVSENMGYTVGWDGATQEITITN